MTMLTIREAADHTGHSTHKIRRLIKAIADDPNHKDRSQIEPTVEDVRRFTSEDIQFTWRVSEELVRQELGDAPQPSSIRSTAGVGELGEVLAMLERALAAKEQVETNLFEQLKAKDVQIAGQQQTINSLSERLRESNVLLATQKRLPGTDKSPTMTATGEKPSTRTAKPAKAARSTPPRRRRWLKAIFAGR